MTVPTSGMRIIKTGNRIVHILSYEWCEVIWKVSEVDKSKNIINVREIYNNSRIVEIFEMSVFNSVIWNVVFDINGNYDHRCSAT